MMTPQERNPLPPKLLEILRTDEPSRAEIERAYRRLRRGARGARAPVWLKTAVLGLCLGGGVAFAATAVFEPLSRRSSAPAPGAPAPALSPQPVAQALRTASPEPARLDPALPDELPSATLGGGVSQPLHAASKPSSVASETASPARAAVSPPTAWQRAAAALREHDWNTARSALLALEHSTDTGEREAARLALAELLINAGQMHEARWRLEDLSSNARSPTARTKAAALLRDSTKK
jgi:hypothetical protein